MHILFILLVWPFWETPSNLKEGKATAALTIEVNNLKSSDGQLMMTVFNRARGFPSDANAAYKNLSQSITGKQVIVNLHTLPTGNYAVAVFHDENGNGQLDKNFFGLPTESYGISNDARGLVSAPTFEQARFLLSGNKTISIALQ